MRKHASRRDRSRYRNDRDSLLDSACLLSGRPRLLLAKRTQWANSRGATGGSNAGNTSEQQDQSDRGSEARRIADTDSVDQPAVLVRREIKFRLHHLAQDESDSDAGAGTCKSEPCSMRKRLPNNRAWPRAERHA